MADKFLENKDIEVGYWRNRRNEFVSGVEAGLNFSLNKIKSINQRPNNGVKINDEKKTKKIEVIGGDQEVYSKKQLDNGRIMYFKGNKFVSQAEYEKNGGK